MHFRRLVATTLASSAFLVAGAGVDAVAAPTSGAPCGFYETSSDAFYNHCTGDGSNVVIHVEVAWAPDYERCVGPGRSWLGSASKIQGAYYTGRTC